MNCRSRVQSPLEAFSQKRIMSIKKESKAYIYRHKRRTVLAVSLCIATIMYLTANAEVWLRTLTAVVFILAFYFLDHTLDIKFHPSHYVIIIIIAIASLLLSPLYFVYPQYDKIQHIVQPFLICCIIFYMINKLPIEYKWKLTFTLIAAFAIVGFFEVIEYGLDHFFDLKLQGVYIRDLKGFDKFNLIQDRIDDTMIDMVLGIVGIGAYMFYNVLKNKIKKI